jgi:hypothetical protein
LQSFVVKGTFSEPLYIGVILDIQGLPGVGKGPQSLTCALEPRRISLRVPNLLQVRSMGEF